MDAETLGAAIAIAKSIPGTAAARAEAAAASVEEAAESISKFENTGLVVVDGKLCVPVERS